MHHRRSFLIGSLSALGAAPYVHSAETSAVQPVVVELFTSQGCSSCPPADELMRKLVDRHEQGEVAVLGLSFHVDYWNYLGWRDPFSSPQWSARQRAYARTLRETRVYTPQMIVQGRDGFVGSRRRQLDAAITRSSALRPKHAIELKVTVDDAGKVSVAYQVDGSAAGNVLNLAVVARELTAKATRGENAGRQLAHANVVRDFKAVRLGAAVNAAPSREATLQVPSLDPKNHSLIAYVQNTNTAAITAALERKLEV